MTRRLTTGYYRPTPTFRAIPEHVAVMDPDTLLLVATTGRAGDPENEADARLFAEAENMLQLLKQTMKAHRAQLPAEAQDLYGGGCGCPQCEQARAIIERIEAK